jgi:hypothetical protein
MLKTIQGEIKDRFKKVSHYMKLGEFERQSLQGLREAVREVYREAMRNNRK